MNLYFGVRRKEETQLRKGPSPVFTKGKSFAGRGRAAARGLPLSRSSQSNTTDCESRSHLRRALPLKVALWGRKAPATSSERLAAYRPGFGSSLGSRIMAPQLAGRMVAPSGSPLLCHGLYIAFQMITSLGAWGPTPSPRGADIAQDIDVINRAPIVLRSENTALVEAFEHRLEIQSRSS